MKETLALVAYGLLLNAGLFMTFFWGRIAMRRGKVLKWVLLSRDTYFMIALCLFISSVGTGILFGARALDSIVNNTWTVSNGGLMGYIILLGLFVVLVAKAGFVWAIHLDRRSWVWKAFLWVSGFWILFAFWWALSSPLI